MPDAFDPMAALEQFATFVSAMTGMKQQLLDAGWSDAKAEELVLMALTAGNAQSN